MSLDILSTISWTTIASLAFAIGLGALIMGWFSRKNHFDVAGKTVLLTGASQGMGLSVAKILSGKGANVIIVARNVGKLEGALSEIKASAASATQTFHYISADLTDASEASRIVTDVMSWNGGVAPDVVWCMAGSSEPQLFLDAPSKVLRNQMDINYWASAEMAQAILKEWLAPGEARSDKQRHFIFTATTLAFYPIVGYSAYSPCKAAMRSLSDTLSQEILLYSDSVKVHTVFPGSIDTPGFAHENIGKPAITKILEEPDPLQSPDAVATAAISGLESGEYLITTNLLGSIMRASAWGSSSLFVAGQGHGGNRKTLNALLPLAAMGQMSPTAKERQDRLDADHAYHKAKLAGRQALAEKIRWEGIEKQWLATKEAYADQAARYEAMIGTNAATGTSVTTTGVLATQGYNNKSIKNLIPTQPNRSLSIISPDPDAIDNTYPGIQRGFWTHGGFPMDDSFGQKEDAHEPHEHLGLHRSADKFNYRHLYQPGTIVSMVWHQDYSFDQMWREHDKQFLTLNRQSGIIFSKRRKFIVVARFQHNYIALPIWTSYADKLKTNDYKNQRVEFMQVLHQGDSIQLANKFKLTPYDYLFQSEKRRQPNIKNRQTSSNSPQRHLEEDWLDMKPDGEALLMLSYPASFDYRLKCHIIGSLQKTSTDYLLKHWATEMQRSMLGHLLGQYQLPNASRAIKADETRRTVDKLVDQLYQQLNINSVSDPSDVWNYVGPAQKKRMEARRAPLAKTLEQLAFVLEAAETLVSEAIFYGVIRETVVDTTRVVQETKEFLLLLVKIITGQKYGPEMPSAPPGRSMGVDSPHSPYSSSWANNQNKTKNSGEPRGPRDPTLGEPRFVSPGSNLNLVAAQHAQLGQNTLNSNPNWDFPQTQPPQTQSPQKKRKRG
ncbi:hypothetical protein V492_03673 [Pseudogymnoascus sp. VKM F-4246]|nr:hypothetical protein V492_03673 [Pseudogymnoascus sp. VKM F-4246]